MPLVELDDRDVAGGAAWGGGVGCFQFTGPPDDGDRNFSLPCIKKILFIVSNSPTPGTETRNNNIYSDVITING